MSNLINSWTGKWSSPQMFSYWRTSWPSFSITCLQKIRRKKCHFRLSIIIGYAHEWTYKEIGLTWHSEPHRTLFKMERISLEHPEKSAQKLRFWLSPAESGSVQLSPFQSCLVRFSLIWSNSVGFRPYQSNSVWFSLVQFGSVWFGLVQSGLFLFNLVQFCFVWFNIIKYNSIIFCQIEPRLIGFGSLNLRHLPWLISKRVIPSTMNFGSSTRSDVLIHSISPPSYSTIGE